MLKTILLLTTILLSTTPVLASKYVIEPTEYQLRNFDNRLEQYFNASDNAPFSETYLRKSDRKRRSDGVVFCSLLTDYSVEDQLVGFIKINLTESKGDQKKFLDETAYTIGVAAAAADTLCTEYRSDFIDFSKKIQDTNFIRSILRIGKAPAPNTDLFTLYMNRGYDAVKANNYDSALILFRMALNERPNNSYALKAIENVTNYINKRSSPKPSSTAAKHSRWVVIGTTSTGETLSLDLSSAYFTGSADYGESAEFTYKFIGNTTTRVNKAVTESCEPNTGKLVINGFLGWDVTEQNGKTAQIPVKAESEASKRMLERVCSQAFVMFKKYGIPGK